MVLMQSVLERIRFYDTAHRFLCSMLGTAPTCVPELQALNSGVNLMLTPRTPVAFQKAGMLSAAGRCKTLDASADGYGRAEAVIAMLLAAPAACGSGAGFGKQGYGAIQHTISPDP